MRTPRNLPAAVAREMGNRSRRLGSLLASLAVLALAACGSDDKTATCQFSDATVRAMTPSCPQYDLPSPMMVQKITVEIQANTSAISDAWVYLHDPGGTIVGSIETNPANYGTVQNSKQFDPAIAVSRLEICSWWNNATLLRLDLEGDPAACTP